MSWTCEPRTPPRSLVRMGEGLTWDRLLTEVSALLAPWGPPLSGSPGAVVSCMSYLDLRRALPHLPLSLPPVEDAAACADLWLEGDDERLERVDLEGYSPGESLARLGLVLRAREYAAAVPGPLPEAGAALLTALRLLLAPEDMREAGGTTYRILGEGVGSADPVLVLPGGPLLDSHYLGDLGGLTARRPVAAVDLPRLRVEDLVAVLEAVRAQLGLDRPTVLAHSAAAPLALAYLAAHPDRVQHLILLCPAVGALGIADDPEGRAVVQRRRAQDQGYAQALAAAQEEPHSVLAQRVSYGAWSDHHAQLALTTLWDRQERRDAYYAEPGPDTEQLRAAARSFSGPVTILYGSDDLHPTARQAHQLGELFPDAQVCGLAGAGHFPWLDDGQAFVRAMEAALG